MTEFTLDSIGHTLFATREDVREARQEMRDLRDQVGKLEAMIDGTLKTFRKELTVTSAMVVRYSSGHIAWEVLERQIQRLCERMERMEARLPNAE
jgi:hypothetical protein